jgi:putative ABC transport system ATP-binding protein
MNDPLLLVEGLGRKVEHRWLWRNVELKLYSGDRLAAIGPSGSGKSLLLRTLAGLDPIQEGQITFQQKSLQKWFMPHYRARVIYLHQRPSLLEGTVESNLQYVYQLSVHRKRNYNRQKILNYLELLGRSDNFLERPSTTLSGGEAQIVAFLRAVQLSPLILLLDEPTASLDAETAHRLEKLVERWQSEDLNRAYLWTSHDREQLKRVTDSQLILGETLGGK